MLGQTHTIPKAGQQAWCELTGGYLTNRGGSVMKEDRIGFVLKFKLLGFWGFFFLTDKLPKHKCLLSPGVIPGRYTVLYQIKWVSERTHVKSKGYYFTTMFFVD